MTPALRTSLQIAAAAVATAIAAIVLPQVLQLFTLINATVFVSLSVLALSLGLVWGFGGILCFGQTAFFGLGGYAYAVAAINLRDGTWRFPTLSAIDLHGTAWAFVALLFDSHDTMWAIPVALAVPTLVAAALGYLMFYGRISDVYMGVITLTVTLILFKFAGSTAGDQWAIGTAPLGGFNGIPSTPQLNLPLQPDQTLDPTQIFQVAVVCLGICYAVAKLVLRTKFGRVAVAIRENEARAELLGYDIRRFKLGIFTLGGFMAGLGGLLFANCVFVSPTMFSLGYAGQVIIWVLVGGLGTLIGPIVGCILVQALVTLSGTLSSIDITWAKTAGDHVASLPVVGPWLAQALEATAWGITHIDPNLLLGLVFILAVLAIPKGLVPTLDTAVRRATRRRPQLARQVPA